MSTVTESGAASRLRSSVRGLRNRTDITVGRIMDRFPPQARAAISMLDGKMFVAAMVLSGGSKIVARVPWSRIFSSR